MWLLQGLKKSLLSWASHNPGHRNLSLLWDSFANLLKGKFSLSLLKVWELCPCQLFHKTGHSLRKCPIWMRCTTVGQWDQRNDKSTGSHLIKSCSLELPSKKFIDFWNSPGQKETGYGYLTQRELLARCHCSSKTLTISSFIHSLPQSKWANNKKVKEAGQ